MNNKRDARDRLDTLLTGLEDEVLSDEGLLPTDVQQMRTRLKGLIEKHTRIHARDNTVSGAESVNDKESKAKSLMGRLSAIVHRVSETNPLPRLKMAFSSKREFPKLRDRTQSRGKRDGGRNDD